MDGRLCDLRVLVHWHQKGTRLFVWKQRSSSFIFFLLSSQREIIVSRYRTVKARTKAAPKLLESTQAIMGLYTKNNPNQKKKLESRHHQKWPQRKFSRNNSGTRLQRLHTLQHPSSLNSPNGQQTIHCQACWFLLEKLRHFHCTQLT